jgi:hypothetical protein
MADQVVPQGAPAGKDWEEKLYQERCARLQEEATRLLRRLDDWLPEQPPSGWKVVGLRKRTMICCFGAVTVSRRLYQDGEGDYHFLLDEYLGWEGYQAATPSVGEAAVSLAAVTSFREAAGILEKVTLGGSVIDNDPSVGAKDSSESHVPGTARSGILLRKGRSATRRDASCTAALSRSGWAVRASAKGEAEVWGNSNLSSLRLQMKCVTILPEKRQSRSS